MSLLGEFRLEDMINVTAFKESGELQEPKVEQMMGKLKTLQQGKRVLEEELKGLRATSDSLQKELSAIQIEADRVEGIHKEKEELRWKLQLQCEESEQDSARHLNQNKRSEELLEHYRCEIQEYKLKQRKQRIRFEKQLQQLIEQHKNLHSVFTLDRLPEELASAENINNQLLLAEQVQLAQLQQLDEELEMAKKQEESVTVAGESVEED